jgi:hypothetical protein
VSTSFPYSGRRKNVVWLKAILILKDISNYLHTSVVTEEIFDPDAHYHNFAAC